MDETLIHCNEMLAINANEPVAFYLAGVALLRNQQVHDGMLMLLNNPDQAAGIANAARREAADKYSLQSYIQKNQNVYLNLARK